MSGFSKLDVFRRISQVIRLVAAMFRLRACQIRGGRERRMAIREKIGSRIEERGAVVGSTALDAMVEGSLVVGLSW